MITTVTAIFAAVSKNVLLGWTLRRAWEIIAFFLGILPAFAILPREYQDLVMGLIQGQGGAYSISVYFGFAVYLATQWRSLHATIRPQIVTTDGQKSTFQPGTNTARQADAVAQAAPKHRSLWEMWTAKK